MQYALKTFLPLFLVVLCLPTQYVLGGSAEEEFEFLQALESFEKQIDYQQGEITLNGGIATIRLPQSFRFIGEGDSRQILTEFWGNPPEAASGVLGMLVPADLSPLSPEGWGIVLTFDESGYVDDKDATSIDFDALLKEMQEGTRAANEERSEAGFPTMDLVGWAEPPKYDSAAKKLYWAKELAIGETPDHTLNYCIRILGRRGVLELNAVATMDQLAQIRPAAGEALAAVEFNEGHRHEDFVPGTDKVAAVGLAGLIVGAAAIKTGFLKMLFLGILAMKKFLIVGVIAIVAFASRFLGGSKNT